MCSTHEEHTSHAAGEKVEGTTFKVADMTCGHCAGTIQKAFDQMMPGVSVGIDLDKREVTVAGDAAVAAETIRAAGYEPQPLAH
jgi:copper chaperone